MDVLHAVENGDLIKKRSGTFDLCEKAFQNCLTKLNLAED